MVIFFFLNKRQAAPSFLIQSQCQGPCCGSIRDRSLKHMAKRVSHFNRCKMQTLRYHRPAASGHHLLRCYQLSMRVLIMLHHGLPPPFQKGHMRSAFFPPLSLMLIDPNYTYFTSNPCCLDARPTARPPDWLAGPDT